MSDAICPRCGDDNITDYPVCDGCATVAHFTHRTKCLHCERKRAAAANREEILTLLHDLIDADSDHPQLARIRLHLLAGRAAALLATMEGTK